MTQWQDNEIPLEHVETAAWYSKFGDCNVAVTRWWILGIAVMQSFWLHSDNYAKDFHNV